MKKHLILFLLLAPALLIAQTLPSPQFDHVTANSVTTSVVTGTPTIATPTLTGHPTIEGVTSTGATGTGNLVFSASPSLVSPNLGTPSAVGLNNGTSTTTGASAVRTLPSRGQDLGVNVIDFGADRTGVADSAAAINAAIAWARANFTSDNTHTFTILFPPGRYLVAGAPLNFTNWPRRGLSVVGDGATLVCQTNGKACVDALGAVWVKWRGLTIFGSTTNRPSIGLQIGRLSDSSSAANHSFTNVWIWGDFTFAGMYNQSGEVITYTNFRVTNLYSGGTNRTCFALVMDGINHWNPPSDYVTVTTPVDSYHSFNENVFIGPDIRATGGCTPVWMANAHRHKWITAYIQSTSAPNAVFIYTYDGTMETQMLDLDAHIESPAVVDEILITGPFATPSVEGLRLRDHNPNATNSILKVDAGITSVFAPGVDFDFPAQMGVDIFADPSLWTVSGVYRLPSGSLAWNLPNSSFAGLGVVGSLAKYSGDGTNITGVVASLPSTISASQINNVGGVITVTLSGASAHYDIATWCAKNGTNCHPAQANQFPAVAVGPSGPGGSQAIVKVGEVSHTDNASLDQYSDVPTGFNIPSAGGTGYAVNDVVTMVGGTCSQVPSFKIMAVGVNGAATLYTKQTAGACSVLPQQPIAVTGGSGSGMTVSGIAWRILNFAVTAMGSGYPAAPAVNVQQTSYNGATTSATSTVSATLQLTAASGAVTLDPTGTALGVVGPGGAPVLSKGALIDNSGVRQSLGASYHVPQNTSLVRFTQSSPVAASSVFLPDAFADGQPVQFVNYAGAVTALTFSPPVIGWTNGNPFAAYSGLRVRWDATDGNWHRE